MVPSGRYLRLRGSNEVPVLVQAVPVRGQAASARVMNDRDLSRPATRHRTSNDILPGLRRIANTRTSNELTEIPSPGSDQPCKTSRSREGSHRTDTFCRISRLSSPQELFPSQGEPTAARNEERDAPELGRDARAVSASV